MNISRLPRHAVSYLSVLGVMCGHGPYEKGYRYAYISRVWDIYNYYIGDFYSEMQREGRILL